VHEHVTFLALKENVFVKPTSGRKKWVKLNPSIVEINVHSIENSKNNTVGKTNSKVRKKSGSIEKKGIYHDNGIEKEYQYNQKVFQANKRIHGVITLQLLVNNNGKQISKQKDNKDSYNHNDKIKNK
jgi:hypothetical protein